jgi:hypothetical protein
MKALRSIAPTGRAAAGRIEVPAVDSVLGRGQLDLPTTLECLAKTMRCGSRPAHLFGPLELGEPIAAAMSVRLAVRGHNSIVPAPFRVALPGVRSPCKDMIRIRSASPRLPSRPAPSPCRSFVGIEEKQATADVP